MSDLHLEGHRTQSLYSNPGKSSSLFLFYTESSVWYMGSGKYFPEQLLTETYQDTRVDFSAMNQENKVKRWQQNLRHSLEPTHPIPGLAFVIPVASGF